MVECICIDDSNKPVEIPDNKWVKKGCKYNIIYTVTVLPQKKIGVLLSEIELDDSCAPYEYFLSNRFAIGKENIEKLIQLIKDCNDTDFSISELLKETQLIES